MKNKKSTWEYEIKHYKNLFVAVTGQHVNIHKIPPESGELGYTTRNSDIFLAENHPVMDKLGNTEKIFFREGVFAHEMCHQLFTDFAYAEKRISEFRGPAKRKIIGLMHNLVEDPAIEYSASDAFGGELLKALRFSIKWIYIQSPGIEQSDNAFSQLVNALIQFGDIGIVKGKFTFDEAKKYFKLIAPEFNRMILEPDAQKRVDAAVRWTELTKPLWYPLYKDNEEMFDAMCGSIEKSTSPISQSKSAPLMKRKKRNEQNQPENSDEIAKRRNEAAEKMENGEPDEFDSVDFDEENSIFDSSDSIDDYLSRSMKNEEDLKKLEKNLEKISKQEKKKNESEDMDISINNLYKQRDNISCLNKKVEKHSHDITNYKKILEEERQRIVFFKNEFKKIFALDYDTYVRATSGHYNINRALKRDSVKIFDKKREARNIHDIAVLLLVDESGSMYGNKIKTARETAVILAESFAVLEIPCSVIGFTADMNGVPVVHNHYVSWKNTLQERATLSQMNAYYNNNDGYSIRYAAEYIRKKKNEHKIMIVISDGLPACHSYMNLKDGCEDTTIAIRQAKKYADIVGIGIQISHEDIMEKMYGGSCVCINEVDELPNELVKQLKRILRNYLS